MPFDHLIMGSSNFYWIIGSDIFLIGFFERFEIGSPYSGFIMGHMIFYYILNLSGT